jgi:putative peptide zinc metalloprotease protein
MVSADNVRQLLRTRLIPMGVVAPKEGSHLSRRAVAGADRSRSPLTLNMRTKVVGPHIIDPIAKVLQVLYAPPILIFVLTTVVITHGWLYLVHGVTGSIRDVLYNPGLFLVVLAITLASAIFHEFGHASALRYGNGKIRGMGVGIYLIYPVFYTDVTDSYGLGRWARVRTGLGGIYFHLIFVLGLVALYLASRQAFLLLVVLLLNLEIVRQFLPFVRLDGYWVLADLIGIPDFFRTWVHS